MSILDTVPTLDFESLEEDLIGVENEEVGGETIQEPFDPTKIRVDTRPYTIDLLLNRIKLGELDLAPSFQRKGGIWNETAQSRLIESMLIRIPLPAFYIDATDENRWLVVDGLQRLTTFKRFVLDHDLRLTGLEFLSQLDGKNYPELPRNYQRRINETQVTVYLIEQGTPSEVKFNIFKRINTGGLALNAQEIRHALNQGPVIELLESLSQSQEFKKATNNSIRSERMDDKECVLRFLAFSLTNYTEYKVKDFDSFLNDAMYTINHMSPSERDKLKERFFNAMRTANFLFGQKAFRKYNLQRVMPINKPLFEAWSVNLAKLTDQEVKILIEKKGDLEKMTWEILNEADFNSAISLSTGNISKVQLRFSRIEQLIQETLE